MYEVVSLEPTVVERVREELTLELTIVSERERKLILDAVKFVYSAKFRDARKPGQYQLRGSARMPPFGLPATFEAVSQAFQSAGISLDPRQIDLYQLGALWCRLLTGESAGAYLRSPRVKGLVPAEVRALLERALGTSGRERFADAREFAVALQAAAVPFGPPPTIPGGEELPAAAMTALAPVFISGAAHSRHDSQFCDVGEQSGGHVGRLWHAEARTDRERSRIQRG